MAKKKSSKKLHKSKSIHKHLRRHFPTFYERPLFGAGILILALLALILFTASH